MQERQTIKLLKRYLSGKASPEEIARVDKWYENEQQPTAFIENKEEVKEQLYNRIRMELDKGATVIPFYRRSFFRIAVAASVLLVIVLGAYLLFNNKKAAPPTETAAIPKDVKAPASNRAMITLADGRTIYLDSAINGELVQQGNIKLVKLDNGQIAYQTADGEVLKEMQYNTLDNPRGSKVIDMALSDGSHVWLNAGSSVRYPIAFVGNERKVTITGEAYFEVAHDVSKPFYVSKGEMNVQVLGTHFNVNAYDDESDTKVTLLEGSVKINSKIIIKPGQQAVINDAVTVRNAVNVEEVMAWKNGLFNFNNADLKTLMRQLSRWYDVEIKFEGEVPVMQFGGELERNLNLSQVLKALEKSKVHFRMEGRTIIVTK